MIKVEELTAEREKAGMSKAELAERMGVPTSIVDEWENQTSEPDHLTLLEIEEIFHQAGESDIEENDAAITEYIQTSALRSTKLAMSIACYICCPVPLIVLLGWMDSDFMAGLGCVLMLVMIALGVYFQIVEFGKRYRYKDVENAMLEQGYKSVDTLKKYLRDYEESYAKRLALGIILCILSPAPVIIATLLFEYSEFFQMVSVGGLFIMVAAGVYQIIQSSDFKHHIKAGLRKLIRRGYE